MVDEAEIRKRKNHLRFTWYEKLMADPEVRKRPNALVFAGHVKSTFNVEKNYAEFSFNDVARKYGMHRVTAARSKKFLVKRGWIQIFERPKGPGGSHLALRYSLAFGPDDLLLEEHTPSSADDT